MAITSSLVVGRINFNDAQVVERALNALRAFTAEPAHYRSLRVKNGLYFEIQDKPSPPQAGWYVLLVGTVPVYVGQAEDLDSRLNSTSGSLDNFAHRARTSDPERNFVKKLCDLGSFSPLRAWFITAAEFGQALSVALPFGELDMHNVEKFINLHRGFLEFELDEPAFNTR